MGTGVNRSGAHALDTGSPPSTLLVEAVIPYGLFDGELEVPGGEGPRGRCREQGCPPGGEGMLCYRLVGSDAVAHRHAQPAKHDGDNPKEGMSIKVAHSNRSFLEASLYLPSSAGASDQVEAVARLSDAVEAGSLGHFYHDVLQNQ